MPIATPRPHVSYQGQLLIAMPGLKEPIFDRSVIYLCQHDAEVAMGLILNDPIEGLSVGQMLAELEIEAASESEDIADAQVYQGGPVEGGRGFILHSRDYHLSGMTLDVTAPNGLTVSLTTSRDILTDMAQGRGPQQFRVALGYSGWGEGQLESELSRNDWLVAPATHELLFATPPAALWEQALAVLGVAPEHLSATAGTA